MSKHFADLRELSSYLATLADSPSTQALRNTLNDIPVADGKISLLFSRSTKSLRNVLEQDSYSASLTHAFWHGTRNITQNIGIYLRLPEDRQHLVADKIEKNLITLCAMLYTNARNFRLLTKGVEPEDGERVLNKNNTSNLLDEVRYDVYPELVRLTAEKTGYTGKQVEAKVRALVQKWRHQSPDRMEGLEFLFPLVGEQYNAA